jgi:U3 small nucleolar RNA-associated protein 25
LQLTLRRLPQVASIDLVDDCRFNLFSKQLWKGIYDEVSEEQSGYTVLLVPQYFDFVKIKTFLKRRNAQVAMISEYTDKKEAQRLRSLYEQKEVPVLMITERALVFEKIRLRFCRNLVLYSIPESPDIIEAI